MRRKALFLTALLLCLVAIGRSQPSQVILADTITPTPTAPLQFTKLLIIPAIITKYANGIIPVNWVAWNPVAQNFAAVYEFGDAQNPIHILDGSTGSKIVDLDSLESTGNSTFAWSPDGKRIAASLGQPNVIKIWTLSGNQKNSPIVINRFGDNCSCDPIFLSQDGLELADTEFVYSAPNSETGSQTLFIWNTQSGKLISRHADMTIGSWSPDGKKMAVLDNTDSHSFLRIVEPDTFHVLFTFPTPAEDKATGFSPYYVVWTPDSHQIIGASCDSTGWCTLWIWDIQTGKVDKYFEQNNDSIGCLVDPSEYRFALNASGTLLASTWWNGCATVYLWDVQSGQLLNSLQTNDGINSLSWNHANDTLLLGSVDGTIQEWKVQRVAASATKSPGQSTPSDVSTAPSR